MSVLLAVAMAVSPNYRLPETPKERARAAYYMAVTQTYFAPPPQPLGLDAIEEHDPPVQFGPCFVIRTYRSERRASKFIVLLQPHTGSGLVLIQDLHIDPSGGWFHFDFHDPDVFAVDDD